MSFDSKYRPATFEDVIGNESTIKILKQYLENKKEMPHAILLHGHSGCGKTTLARIMAKELECAPTDIYEINMGNNRGIDTAREIMQYLSLNPIFGTNRIFILDEAHKTTKDFQNAMLKCLEDAPEHSFFFLCTTDPSKLIKTIRNRCAEFEIQKPMNSVMRNWLYAICEKEEIIINETWADELIDSVDNCPREALIVLEKVKAFGAFSKEVLSSHSVQQEETVLHLCRALLHPKASWKTISRTLEKLDEEPESIRRAVLGYMSKVALSEDNPQAILIIDSFQRAFYDSGKAGLIKACYECILKN